MRSIDFYEFVGIFIPGAVLLAAIGFLLDFGLLKPFLNPEGIGNAVIYMVLAYVTGHLIAAVGNWFEALFWRFWKGMPTDWPLTRTRLNDSTHWKSAIEEYCGEKCGSKELAKWRRLVSTSRSKLYASNRATRIHAFNGNYGMFRGLAVVELVIAALAWKSSYNLELVYSLVGVTLVLTLFRMHHFGKRYAGELFSNITDLNSSKANQ